MIDLDKTNPGWGEADELIFNRIDGQVVVKYNENHDEAGRFASSEGGAVLVNTAMARAIIDYQTLAYRDINASLRGLKSGGYCSAAEVKTAVRVIDAALKNNVTTEPMVLYRGISGEFGARVASESLIGLKITDKGFVSTTTDLDVAKRFAHTADTVPVTLARIHISAGAQALPLTQIEGHVHDAEKEVLLPRGQTYEITKMGKLMMQGGRLMRIVDMELV